MLKVKGEGGTYEIDNGDIKFISDTLNRCRGFEIVSNAPTDTKLPVRGSNQAAGYDFFAPHDFKVPAHGFSCLVSLNIKAYMLPNEYLALCIRSSLATTKADLVIAQGTAIIDADYYNNPKNEGNIGVMFYNRSDKDYHFKKGDRCCQGIFMEYKLADVDMTLGSRLGGYGSSGK